MKTFTAKIFCLTIFLLSTLPSLLFADGRQKTNFNSGWKFRSQITTNGPAASTYNDTSWETVDVPHTWNKTDASDGGGNYLKTVGWYRKNLTWQAEYEGKKIFLEFLGANTKTECFVNGTSLGIHKGGYTAFRYDITDKLTTGNNVIAIKVDNRIDQEIAPLSGDFSFYGGIYRDVSLIVTDPVHVELMDKGAPGLYLTTTSVSEISATLEVKAMVYNESSSPVDVTLKADIRHPDTFDAIENVEKPLFDISTMAPGGAPIKTITETVTIPANSSYEFKKSTTINNPRLWNGKKDPYRYLVDFTVDKDGTVLDNLSEFVGFRYFAVSASGFHLNGTLYPLRGVNRHQDRMGMGNAISQKEHNEDFGMLYEIGANAVRLAHYPQDPYMYELCDKYGLIVWAEIPFLDKLGSNEATFREVTKNQLVEMIRQQYNRPSILMWGLQNEVSTGSYNPQMSTFMPEMHNLAKAEDPSRLTVQAQAGTERYNWTTDLYAKNQYPGWYQGGTFGSYMDARKYSSVGYYVGMSEYGAGGNIHQHEINPAQPTHNGQWHPEEYQNKVHEEAVVDISTRNWIWGTFVWNMFDFGSDSRNEGEQPGINDKGLVTFDRKVKKDSYYVYKVNWNSEPELYITSRRYVDRNHDVTPVIVYSNCESVELFVNGVSQGVKQYSSVKCGIFKWTNITLPNKGQGDEAKNTILIKGIKDGKTYEDEVVWNRLLGQSIEITSTKLVIDLKKRTISLNSTVAVSALSSTIKGVDGATLNLYKADGTTLVTSGYVEVGMKLKVTSEDGKTSVFYEFISGKHLALKKTVTCSAQESSNLASYAVDGNVATRWAGTSTGNHWIEVDLGKEYFLDQIRIQWFFPNPSRWYTYNVLASNNKSTYATIVNRSSNTQGGVVTDSELLNKGKYRYVKVNVLSATTSGYPSLYELEVYGWLIESTEYDINLTTKTITVPYRGDNITIEQFLNNVNFLGNYGASPVVNSSAYYLINGDKLTITDINGNEVDFTITLKDYTNLPELSESNTLVKVTNDGPHVFFSLNDNITDAKLDIMDLSGRVLKSLTIESQYEICLSKEAYIFKVSKDGYKSQQIKYLIF